MYQTLQIITCFFIDTANNVLDYVETISSLLKPGGYWINLGECAEDYLAVCRLRFVQITDSLLSEALHYIRHYTYIQLHTTAKTP
jgi:hypothetical protein